MLSIILEALQQISKILIHDWDTLVKKIGKPTANVLLTLMTLGILFEIFWLTLVISVLLLSRSDLLP